MEQYQVVRTIGQGSFGKVYLVCDKNEQSSYCLKVVNLKSIAVKEREACKTEIELMHGLVHPNIVSFKESFLHMDDSFLCIVMAFCDGGDLAERLERNKGKLIEETQVLSWFVQILLGLHYMHTNNVLHRDLKTQNIFLLGNGRLVLGDFGISKKLAGEKDFAKTQIGTPYYMSPEQFRSKPYSFKSDVWSLGCVLYEMTTLRHPFDACSMNELTRKILAGRYAPISSRYSRHLKLLIKQLLCSTPRNRPSLHELAQTSFIRRNIFEFLKDMLDRPNLAVGPGTMLVRNAITAGVSQDSNEITANLQKQLIALGLKDLFRRVSKPVKAVAGHPDENSCANSTSKMGILEAKNVKQKVRKCRRKVVRQNNALLRAEERKRAVENALSKLERERELRIKARQDREKEREQRREKQRKRAFVLAQRKQKALEDRRKAVQLRAKQKKGPESPSKDKLAEVASPFTEESRAQLIDESECNAIPSTKERVLAAKQRRQLEQEKMIKNALCKAREERMKELQNAANQHNQQFAASPDNGIVRIQDGKTAMEQDTPEDEQEFPECEVDGSDEFDVSGMEHGEESLDLDVKKASLQKELDIAKTICRTLMSTITKPIQDEVLSSEEEFASSSNSESELESDSDLELEGSVTSFSVQGWLAKRSSHLRSDCVNALGEELFRTVHGLLKTSLESKLSNNHSVEAETCIRAQVKELLVGKLEYVSKIDNLIFMQETL